MTKDESFSNKKKNIYIYIVKNICQNKIKQIKNNINLLQNILTQVKKRKRLFRKRLKKISKM